MLRHIVNMKFDLSIRGADKLRADLRSYNRKTQKRLQREVDNTATKIHRTAREMAPNDTGGLRWGINIAVRYLSAVVWSSADYSLAVERGQKPGTWPNPYLLQGWVKRKLKISKKRLKSVTFLVGRKIFRKGTEAQPYFGPAVKKYKTRFFQRTRRIIMETKV